MGLMEIDDRINQILDAEEDKFAVYITELCLQNGEAFDSDRYDDKELLQITQDLLACANKDRTIADYLKEHDYVERVITSVLKLHHYPEEQLSETARITFVHYMEDSIEEQIALGKEECTDWQEPELPESDAHVIPFAEVLAHIPYTPDDIASCESIGVTYDYEQLHMVRWFASQMTLGQGAYGRANPNPSARATYNRLRYANSLLWICSVLGVERNLIRQAAEEAGDKRQGARPCGIIRQLIPFDDLLPLAQHWYDVLFPIGGTQNGQNLNCKKRYY